MISGRHIRKVVILANSTKPNVEGVCERFCSYFTRNGIQSSVVMLSATVEDQNIEVPDCDLAISLGGDGTVLTCVDILRRRSIPILAVNFGTFGYIAETSINEMERVFEDYISSVTGTFSRMMLDVSVLRDGVEVFSSAALNDVTVSAVSNARMARIDMYVNGIHGANLKADGLIIATPTGSTAYNLAAGGPIIEDSLDAIIINPICPFAMSVRPLVLNAESVVSIRIPRQNIALSITCDGHQAFTLQENDSITVKRCEDRAVFVQNQKRRFIEVLRDKLGWAGGFNA